MERQDADSTLIEQLHARFGITPRSTTYDDQGALVVLDLSDLELGEVPTELGQLSSLQILYLSGNDLGEIPAELGQLSSLQRLYLNGNLLEEVPAELGQLSNLQTLCLSGNLLKEAPAELGQLSNLQTLYLDGNQLRELPAELGQLSNLQRLELNANQLRKLPAELGQLSNLQQLYLDGNRLRELPTELGQLSNLQTLYLNGNLLREVPAELGQLSNLQTLYLNGNRLKEIPAEWGQLSNLQTLDLDENPHLSTPPPEIVKQGTTAILTYLQELRQTPSKRYEAKLILVGEGGIGKSSLLRAFQRLPFDPALATTHGIEIASLKFPHPSLPEESLTLNAWDFGGQQVYQATHQFFLTERSLYLVVWNARLGGEQCRLDYWLNTIRVIAPDAPVLLVATHIDERVPDLNILQYRAKYPQIVDVLQVSNKTGKGIPELKETVAMHAATLPLMGQSCPISWIKVEQALLVLPEHHISADTYKDLCIAKGVQGANAQGLLGGYLHDLGKILYFRDDPILSAMVILKPNWITKAISQVLEDRTTCDHVGILAHADLPRIWTSDGQHGRYDPALYPIFLHLMERFELCYQIHPFEQWEHVTHSLIPQLLPYEPPASLPTWTTTDEKAGKVHVEMTYQLDFVPAGIMSWFIVRTHRYTTNLHWREGVVLAYQNHLARVELFPLYNELKIEVWGIEPRTFLVILKDTLDVILSRFAGLQIRREVPCLCHQQTGEAQPCSERYRYEEDLIMRLNKGVKEIECRKSFHKLLVHELLYGIHESTFIAVEQEMLLHLRAIRDKQDLQLSKQDLQLSTLMQQIGQYRELMIRYFTRQWNLDMQKMKTECPNTFYLIPGSKTLFNPINWIGSDYKLFLMCQHPSEPHCVRNAKGYDLRQTREWWVKISPWLKHLIKFLKVSVPIPVVGGMVDLSGDLYEYPHKQVELLEKITEDTLRMGQHDLSSQSEQPHADGFEQSIGPALRILHSFLNEVDPHQHWEGLEKVVTEDGNIFWLCQEHAHPYKVQPLHLYAS